MKENIREFPQVDGWGEENLSVPEVNVVGIASSTGQAKRLPDILKRIAQERYDGDISKVDSDCAVVLPDENLLVPVLNSIPAPVADINVTMGLPMQGSLVYAMMEMASSLQIHSVCRGGRWFFYHKQVWDIFSNAVFRKAADEKTLEIVDQIKTSAKYYIPQEELSGTPLLEASILIRE